MAILSNCRRCGSTFGQSASNHRSLCDECDGTNDKIRSEESRWKAMTADQKCDELRERLNRVECQVDSDGLIG